jgi:hypothetical protein
MLILNLIPNLFQLPFEHIFRMQFSLFTPAPPQTLIRNIDIAFKEWITSRPETQLRWFLVRVDVEIPCLVKTAQFCGTHRHLGGAALLAHSGVRSEDVLGEQRLYDSIRLQNACVRLDPFLCFAVNQEWIFFFHQWLVLFRDETLISKALLSFIISLP